MNEWMDGLWMDCGWIVDQWIEYMQIDGLKRGWMNGVDWMNVHHIHVHVVT